VVKIAGAYPDPPSYRMAYDKDGTIVVSSLAGAITQQSAGTITQLNDESDNSNGPTINCDWLAFIFPEKRDIDGFFVAMQRAVGGSIIDKVEVSNNTTTGADGTWTQIQAQYTITGGIAVNPNYRTDVKMVSSLGIRAIRFTPGARGVSGSGAGSGNWTWPAVHLYGSISPGENPHRLALWNPTSDVRVSAAWFDWGDCPRGSSADKTFRVKNISSAQTANTITVSVDVLTDATGGAPPVGGQHTLSTDGTTFTATISIGNLAPGAMSGVLTIRRNTPSNAQLGVWAFRVQAAAATWV
jgi:hypothetical protein